jgi:phosphohistidine phosphatase
VRLIMLRHAVALDREDWPPEKEFERPLTEFGKKKLKAVLRAFQRRRMGEDVRAIYTSPLVRARDTAEIAGKLLGIPVHLVSELQPGGQAFEWLRGVQDEQCMVVGHEPDMSELAARCLGLRAPLFEHKKSGMSCFEGTAGEMELRWLVTPKWVV